MEHKPNLIGTTPEEVMIHGFTKRYVDKYHWHSPNVGLVASFTPRDIDVVDHFGLFRGVDQIEAFSQAVNGGCGAYRETIKLDCTFDYLKKNFTPVFVSVDHVEFKGVLREGETFICIGYIKFYKFRQIVCSGRIYKVPKGLDLDEYFKNYTDEKLLNYDLSEDFELIAEITDLTGRALKNENIDLNGKKRNT